AGARAQRTRRGKLPGLPPPRAVAGGVPARVPAPLDPRSRDPAAGELLVVGLTAILEVRRGQAEPVRRCDGLRLSAVASATIADGFARLWSPLVFSVAP